MTDVINSSREGLPWRPTDVSLVTDVFDEWDVPTLGVLNQHGMLYVFTKLVGNLDAFSLWVYAHVSPAEVSRLKVAEGRAFEDALNEATTGRYLRVALYDGTRRVLLSDVSHGPTDGGITSVSTFNLIQPNFNSLLDEDTEELRAELAVVEGMRD